MVSGVLLIVMVHMLMMLELSVDSLDTTHIVRSYAHCYKLLLQAPHPCLACIANFIYIAFVYPPCRVVILKLTFHAR